MSRPLDEEQARAVVQAAFAAVRADDVRVNIDARESAFVRFARNEATTSGQITDVVVKVSCALQSRHATVEVHGLRSDDVQKAARRARELAELAPQDPEYLPSPGPSPLKPVAGAWSDAPLGPDERAALVATAIDEAKRRQLVGFGFLEQQRTTKVTATRAGFFGIHHGTAVGFSTTARVADGNGSGWACGSAIGPKELDVAAVAGSACDKALRSRHARALDAGVYPVVLEPAAVGALMPFLSLEARDADEGRSPFSKPGGGSRVGEKLLGELSLACDPWSPLEPSAPFDEEGMPRAPVTWVKSGVLVELHNSRYWAKKNGRKAHAQYDRYLPSGPRPQSLEALVAGLDRGLLVTRLWYVRPLEPQTMTVTGLTRDGVFLVEKGKIVAPVNNFRFNQSILQMFVDADGYGAPTRLAEVEGATAAPAVRTKAFHMSSRSDAV
jgi:predicted Zn-dependent protease